MRQSAKVIALLPNGEAQVTIKRESACGHDCTSCGACGAQARPIIANVVNAAGARVGDTVEIESKTSRIMALAFIVYVVPIILFFAFYVIANAVFKSEGGAIIGAMIGLLFGIVVSIIVNRFETKKRTTSTIVRVID